MAWVEAHQSLANHPKLFHLMDLTDLPRDRCIGRLFLLWTWALEFAEDGDLSRFSPDQIGFAVGIDGPDQKKEEREKFFHALLQSGFVEEEKLLIHDWLDYAGLYLIKKYSSSNRNKLKEIWSKHGFVYGRGKSKGTKYKRKTSERKVNQKRDIPLPLPMEEEKNKRNIALPSSLPTPSSTAFPMEEGKSEKAAPSNGDSPSKGRKKEKEFTKEEYFAHCRAQIPDRLETHRGTWKEAYPNIDLEQESKKALSWLISHPKERRSQFDRFLNSWFTKAEDDFKAREIKIPRARSPDIGGSKVEKSIRRTAKWVPPEERKKP
jgi:hypothetical protein